MCDDPVTNRGTELLVGHQLAAQPDHRIIRRKETVEEQVVEGRNQSPTGQVTRTSEDDECTGIDGRNRFLRGADIDAWAIRRRRAPALSTDRMAAEGIPQCGQHLFRKGLALTRAESSE